jgi:molecular chaperone GrpE (heat shock protein)
MVEGILLQHWNVENEKDRLSVVEEDIKNLLKEREDLRSLLEANNKENIKKEKNFLLNILDVIDAFDRVLNNIEDKKKQGTAIDRQMNIWIGNFKAVRRKFEGIIKDTGVSRINAPEGKAIPGWHTIVETRGADGLDEDTILEEIQKGYLWNKHVLRNSLVVTVKNNKED